MRNAVLALALLLALTVATDTVIDLSKDIKDVDGDGNSSGSGSGSTNGAGNVNTKAVNEQKPAQVTDDGDMQTISAKVGDTVSLQLDEPVDGKGLTWDIIELVLGYNKIWKIQEENFVLNDDGKAGVRTFKLKLEKPGEEVVTLVRGDMTKFDDADAAYEDNTDHLFNLDLMKGAEYTQIKVKAE